jgi:hypothetical protein
MGKPFHQTFRPRFVSLLFSSLGNLGLKQTVEVPQVDFLAMKVMLLLTEQNLQRTVRILTKVRNSLFLFSIDTITAVSHKDRVDPWQT